MKRIGVLALQGAVQEHLSALEVLENIEARPVKTMAEIEAVDGLIFPGGSRPLSAGCCSIFPCWSHWASGYARGCRYGGLVPV